MPWGTSEGGVPQPYRMEVLSANWEKARDRDGNLVESRGENLMNLVFEGNAHRLTEGEDGYELGEAIEPVDGKHNRRSFLIGNTSQWVDPREDGKKIEATRGPDEMPWAKSEVGRLINSLVELVGADELETWGAWEEASTWSGRTYDLVPTHDVNDDGSPVTFKKRDGSERVDWYFVCVNVEGGGGGKAKKPAAKGGRRRGGGSASMKSDLISEWKGFEGSDDEFLDHISGNGYKHSDALAKLSDDDFESLMEEVLG